MKCRRTKQLELILAELQAIRAHLEAGPPSVSTNYTVTTSGFGYGEGAPAQGPVTTSGDPGLVQLQELLYDPHGPRATELREMPTVEVPEGKSVYELIEGALDKRDLDLLSKIKAR